MYTSDFSMSTLANSEDPHEMPQSAAFHQDIHYLLLTGTIFKERKIQFYWANITCGPSIYSMDHPKLNVSSQEEESINA